MRLQLVLVLEMDDDEVFYLRNKLVGKEKLKEREVDLIQAGILDYGESLVDAWVWEVQ